MPDANEEYTREFVKEFGVPDPDQDWSLATSVAATVDQTLARAGYTVRVFNAMPGNPDCQIAALMEMPAGSFSFDFPKDATRAYVQVTRDDGRSAFAGYLPIESGRILISSLGARDASAVPYLYDFSTNPGIGTFFATNKYTDVFDWKSYFGEEKFAEYKAAEETDVVPSSTMIELNSANFTVTTEVEPEEEGGETTSKTETLEYFDIEDWNKNIQFSADQFQALPTPDATTTVTLTFSYKPLTTETYSQWVVKHCGTDWPALESCKAISTNYNEGDTEPNGCVTIDQGIAAGTVELKLTANDVANIKANGMAIAGISYSVKNDVAIRVDVTPSTKGAAKFTDAFKIYGMSTVQAGDMNAFRNSYVKGTPFAESAANKASDLVPIVGTKGVFNEEIKDDVCNMYKYGTQLHIGDGVEYVVAKPSTVTLDYFFGGTAYFNSFGYFYYNTGETREQIMRKPKFLLMFDASPSANLQVKVPYDDRIAQINNDSFTYLPNVYEIKSQNRLNDVLMESFDNWPYFWQTYPTVISRADSETEYYQENYSGEILPTSYQLVYYPLDNNGNVTGAGSYEFPAGTHICFFLIMNGQAILDPSVNDKGITADVGNMNFSLPWMNKAIGNTFKAGLSSHAGSDTNPDYFTGDDPWTPFVTYLWNGQYILGVEDGSRGGDHDMNDMLFIINGEVVPETEVEELNKNVYNVQSWILAAEDLGQADDYDFNDVVVGISHLTTNNVAANYFTVTPLAAGGTLPVYLKYDGQTVGGQEFHQFFGMLSDEMVNTSSLDTKFPEPIKIELGEDAFTLEDILGGLGNNGNNAGKFSIEVENANGTVQLTTGKSLAPEILILNRSWRWPKERFHIKRVYSKFDEWVKDTSVKWTGSEHIVGPTITHSWKGDYTIPNADPSN